MTALIVLEHPECETLRVPVLKVFDGDGFLTRIHVPRRNAELELAVRFGFIDAPEMDQPGGPAARDFLASLIGGRCVDLAILTKMDTGGIVDRHGRLVCVPFLIGNQGRQDGPSADGGSSCLCHNAPSTSRNIELEIVLNGWAWVLTRYGPDPRYLEALSEAREERRGIWARDANEHPWAFKKRQYRNQQPYRAAARAPDLFSVPLEPAPCSVVNCDGRLVERNGRFGRFYGCSNYPGCKYSCRTLAPSRVTGPIGDDRCRSVR